MNGFVVGSGPTSATWPRLRGLSTHADSVIPCAGGGSRPSCMYIAATMWNWTSGASSPSRVRTKPPLSARFDVNGPPPPIQWPRFSSVSASFSEQSSSLRVDDAGGRVVGQVQAELGRLGDDRD